MTLTHAIKRSLEVNRNLTTQGVALIIFMSNAKAWQMYSPDDASLHEMKSSLYCINNIVIKFQKNTQSKHWDSNSFPALPKHEKCGLQFWSGFALTFGHCEL